MNMHTSLALACLFTFTGCKQEPKTSAQLPAKQATATQVVSQPSKTPPKLPTAAQLTALIDQATRIEAKSGSGQEPTWSKDLTKEDIANLKAGIGEAKFSAAAPRCLPTVTVTLYRQDKELATLGGFCGGDNPKGLMRFDIDGTTGSLTSQDSAKVNTALESPVDR